jgi:hypothetical protein
LGSVVKKALFGDFRAMRTDDEGSIEVVNPPGGVLDVYVQDQTSEVIDLYLYSLKESPVITSDAYRDDVTISVDSSTGIVAGDLITIYENEYIFQSIVKSVTATTITMCSPLDNDFSISSDIEIGNREMGVDGDPTPVVYSIRAPIGLDFDVYRLNFTINDSQIIDDICFGSLFELNNGLIVRYDGTYVRNLSLIRSNNEFFQHGYKLYYIADPQNGTKAVHITKDFRKDNGVSLRLRGDYSDRLVVTVQDDIDGLDRFRASVSCHVVV